MTDSEISPMADRIPPGICILLVDDHSLVRDGVEAILELEKDIGEIIHAASCAEALDAVRLRAPDIVLLDRRMPEGDGFDLLPELVKIAPKTRVIMMTASATPREVEQARSLGAAGHLPKSVRRATLIGAIRTVLGGDTYFVSQSMPAGSTGRLLSPRELEVLECVRRGLHSNDIALMLGISEYTVKAHLKSIFGKLDAAGRAEAVTRGFELGILSI
jgi:DNA-binding NarL/FixJ family response regulator